MILKKACLCAATLAATFGLIACGDDSSSSSAPEAPAVSSSSENLVPGSSSSFDPENFDLEEFEKNLPEDCNTLEDSTLVSLCHLYKLNSMLPNSGNMIDLNKCNEIEDLEERTHCITNIFTFDENTAINFDELLSKCNEIEDPDEQERCKADVMEIITLLPADSPTVVLK